MRIDHNPHEKRPTNAIWWAAWAVIIVNWIGYLYYFHADWVGVCLGLGTGALLAAWAIEITGNKPFGSRRD